MTLRNKLLIAMAAILLISFVVIGSGVSIYLARSEEAAWQSRQLAGARQAALAVETFLEKAQAALVLLGLFDQHALVEHPEHIRGLLKQHPSLLEVVRVGAAGGVIAAGYVDEPMLNGGFPVILTNWFQTARAGEPYIGNIQFTADNSPYIIMALPAPNGEVLAARLRMELLWEIVGNLRFTPTSTAYLFDLDGHLLAHTLEATVATHNTIHGRPEYLAIKDKADYGWYGPYVNLFGERVYGASIAVAGTGWIIVTEVMCDEVFSLTRSALLMLAGGMFVFAMAVMLLTGDVLQNFIFSPIQTLYRGAQRIGNGDLNHRIPSTHKNEIGAVAAAFNEMAERLHERNEQIQARSAALAAEVAQRQRAELALLHANEELESKVAERTAALSAVQARLEQLLTSSAAVIYSISLQGEPKLTYFSANVAVLTGYTADKILQSPTFWFEHLHPEDQERYSAMAAALQKSGHEVFDYRFLCKEGEYRWMRDEARIVFNQVDNAPEIIGTLVDINTRKLAEQELRHARDEALQASRLKSQFVANMSHEIRTPMNGILGMAELLSMSTLDQEQKEAVDMVRASGVALMSVINDILDFSKIEANHVELQASDFVLQSAVEEVAELVATRAREKKLTLKTVVAPELPAVVRGDPMRVRQVLLNLVSNAVKFTIKGEVVVRAVMEPNPLGSKGDKPVDKVNVRFSISDTGAGIAHEDLARLFQPFVQIDGSNSRANGGTGLGLAISKRLVELMGGTIGVDTTVGQGSTFWFTLEFEPGIEQGARQLAHTLNGTPPSIATGALVLAPSDYHATATMQILLVEDNLVNQKVATQQLKKLGYCVELANDGQEAVDKLSARVYDLVLMDCQMPRVDGFTATKLIRQREAECGGHIPIVAMTANAMEGDRDLCLQAGMDDYIPKPVRIEQLREMVERWLTVTTTA